MDTIAAIATPPGSGGIGIVRISGDGAVPIATRLFRRSGNRPCPDPPTSHRLYHGHILSLDSGEVIDEVLMVVMQAPHSYTREDVVEIQAHAGQAVLRAVLERVLAAGARLADPGEFTRRAFLSGRIDLTQAEAVIDVINAQSERALTAAAGQLQGAMGDRLRTVRRSLRDILARIDAAIDFSEDGIETIPSAALAGRLETEAIRPLADLCRGYENARLLRDGLRMAVVGRPNVGKSSLMNALLNDERAIVTPFPGTTRDVIEAPFSIDGVPIVLLDTAGLHMSDDPVEIIGVERTRHTIEAADVILLVLDASEPITEEDRSAFHLTQSKARIIVTNKWDRVQDDGPLGLPGEVEGGSQTVKTSALLGDGIEDLRKAISDIALGDSQAAALAMPNLRHHKTLSRGLEALRRARSGIDADAPLELTAIDLHEAERAIGDILGDAAPPDLLDHIFSQFCIGK